MLKGLILKYKCKRAIQKNIQHNCDWVSVNSTVISHMRLGVERHEKFYDEVINPMIVLNTKRRVEMERITKKWNSGVGILFRVDMGRHISLDEYHRIKKTDYIEHVNFGV